LTNHSQQFYHVLTMIDVKLKYQASIFVNAADISVNPDTIKDLIDLFRDKDLIPRTLHEINVPGSGPFPSARPSMSSSNGEWIINFRTVRIDVVRSTTDLKGTNMGEIEEFCGVATDFFERISTRFKKKANRLALVTDFILEEMTTDALSKVYLKLFKPTKFYVNHPPFEWVWKSVSKMPFAIREIEDLTNVLSTVSRAKGDITSGGETMPFERIILQIDINTAPENSEYRFDIDDIKDFYNKIPKEHSGLTAEALEHIYG
jgi:hypothetical protein